MVLVTLFKFQSNQLLAYFLVCSFKVFMEIIILIKIIVYILIKIIAYSWNRIQIEFKFEF